MKRSTLCAIAGSVLFALFTLPVHAQKLSVKSLEVQGNSWSDTERIKLNSGLLPIGKTITGDDIAEAIKNLWNLGSFSDVKVKRKEVSNASAVDIVIEVQEHPRLDAIQVTGNKEIDKDNLLNRVNFYRGQTVSPSRVKTGQNKIRDYYREKGFLLASVEAETVKKADDRENRVSVVYKINEGQKVKIQRISFTGNNAFNDGKLRKQFKKTKEDGLFTGGNFVEADFEEDKKLLVKFYNKEGFVDAKVVSDSISYNDTKKDMYIDVKVDEGVKYFIRNITFKENALLTDEDLTSMLKFKSGDAYNEEKIEEVKGEFTTVYYNMGHIYTGVRMQRIPAGKDSLDLEFTIDEKNAVTINKIDILGNTKTKEKVIRRELRVKPGDVFSSQAIERSMRGLMILNFFQTVDPQVKPIDEEKINLQFTIEEKSTDTANMSAGFSQRDGLIGSLGLAMNNFLGNGQRVSLDWQFGKIYRSFQIGFTEPFLFDTPTLAGINIFDLKRGGEFYGFDQNSTGITLQLGRRLNWPDNFFRVNGFFEFSQNEISNLDQGIRNASSIFFREQNTTRVSITQVISRDSRNHPEFPTLGSNVSYSTQFSGGFLGGGEDFVKHKFGSEWYMPTFWKFILFQNLEVGTINTFNGNENITPQELFYMGGSALSLGTSLRGYDERSIGPLSSQNGFSLGGKAMAKFTSELRFPVSNAPTIYGLLFAEAGNIWEENRSIDPFNMRRSYGGGIRLFLPMVGMIGIDFGYGVDNFDRLGNREGWKTHFQFGRGF